MPALTDGLELLLSVTVLPEVILRLSVVYPEPLFPELIVADFRSITVFLPGVVLIFLCLETEDEVPIVSLLFLTDGDVDLEIRLSIAVFDLLPELSRVPEIFCLFLDCEA